MNASQPPSDVGSTSRKKVQSNNSKKPMTFKVAHTMCLEKVASKITSQKQILSSAFFCRHDPTPSPPSFQLKVDFGEDEVGFLGVSVLSVDKVIYSAAIKVILSDDQGVLAEDYESLDEEIQPDEYTGFYEFYELAKASTTKSTTWRITCVFTYRNGPSKAKLQSSESNLKVHDDYLRLLNEATNADVAFVVQGERIMAHKGVLSTRSDYFSNMFRSDVKENTTNEVLVPDVKPKVFKAMLEFLYSGLPPKNLSDVALDLLVIADKYCVGEMKEFSQKSILDNIRADNVADVLLIAHRIGDEVLKTRAKVAFRGYSDAFKPSSSAIKRLQTNPLLVGELLLHFCKD